MRANAHAIKPAIMGQGYANKPQNKSTQQLSLHLHFNRSGATETESHK